MTHETLCADWTDAERSAEMHIYLRTITGSAW